MRSEPPPWILEAETLPIAFAQVREDPLLDLEVARRLGDAARVIMVASGGCTAALLACAPSIARVQLVDPNPAQLALCRLKLALLRHHDRPTRLAVLGHAPLDPARRLDFLAHELESLGLALDALGPPGLVASLGPDRAGRYERVFAAIRGALGDATSEMDAVLRLSDPQEQQRRLAPASSLGRSLDEALDTVMSLANLVRLFGKEATKNPVEPFARHFARRIRHVAATAPCDRSPFLWQMLAPRAPEGHEPCWLREAAPHRLPDIAFELTLMKPALDAHASSHDFVHLSNILDWLSPEEAQATLESSWHALRPNGLVLIRQLNSTLDIPRLGPMFDWLTADAAAMHGRDRSFFYRALHLGRRR